MYLWGGTTKITYIFDYISELKNLEILDLGWNPITNISPFINNLINLKYLSVDRDNSIIQAIETLPKSIFVDMDDRETFGLD